MFDDEHALAPFVIPIARRPSPHSSAGSTARANSHGIALAEVARCPSAALLRRRIHSLSLWISLIRGVHRFAPYAAQQSRGRGSPSPPEPLQPFPADDADH